MNAAASGAHSNAQSGGKRAKPATATRRVRARDGSAGTEHRESKSRPRRKTAQRRRAGGVIASDSGQVGKDGSELQTRYRKLDEMEKLEYTLKSAAPEPQPAPVSVESIRELVAPHEWEAMLNAFEESGIAPASQPTKVPGEIGIEAEDLWERLSSTRWLKELNKPCDDGSEDLSNKSTVANRK